MAHHKRKRARTFTQTSKEFRPNGSTSAWNIVMHSRPSRRHEVSLERDVMRDEVDPEDLAWPMPRKPKKDFW